MIIVITVTWTVRQDVVMTLCMDSIGHINLSTNICSNSVFTFVLVEIDIFSNDHVCLQKHKKLRFQNKWNAADILLLLF